MTRLLILFITLSSCIAAASSKINILLIYSDDHGWADLGAQGVNAEIQTPNLDQLARDGVRFTRGYVSAPQCVPSRAGVMTGRYQQRFGVEDNAKGPLPLDERTIAERLKPAGYLTGQVGKWHLDIGGEKGKKKDLRVMTDHMPNAQGFDEYFRGEMLRYYASHDLKSQPFADAPHLVDDKRFRVEVQTEAALAFLDRRGAKPEQPWFLYLAWYAPHVPLDSPEPWFSKTPANLPKERRQALSMIACMDDGLGRIREKLRTMGQDKNTLIFFIGDNGAPLGGAWNGSLNLPLIGQKGMLAEGGIRTPFVAAWPGTLPAGAAYDEPVISLDVAATAVALAGQPNDQLDGVNLMPFVTGQRKGAPHQTLYWRWGSQAAIQEMPYKLIMIGERERLLFDITKPEGENIARNLVKQKPEIAQRLEAKLKAWSQELTPPGLPTTLDAHHEGLFAEHDLIPKPPVSAAPDVEGSIKGWVCRGGTLELKNAALAVKPEAKPKGVPFITMTKLDLPGAVELIMQVRTQHGGAGFASWRTQADKDFDNQKKIAISWPTTREWQEVKVNLPVEGKLVHLRVGLPQGADDVEIHHIELRAAKGKPLRWDFGGAK